MGFVYDIGQGCVWGPGYETVSCLSRWDRHAVGLAL